MKNSRKLTDTATCSRCGRERTADDAEDYSPMQIILNEDPGWYSSADEDFCGPCVIEMIRRQP